MSSLFPLCRRYSKQKARSRVQSTTSEEVVGTRQDFFFSIFDTQEDYRNIFENLKFCNKQYLVLIQSFDTR